jgi:hypothetical protein
VTTAIEDPDLCLWCGSQPARVFGFCLGCAADALTIPDRNDPIRSDR